MKRFTRMTVSSIVWLQLLTILVVSSFKHTLQLDPEGKTWPFYFILAIFIALILNYRQDLSRLVSEHIELN